MPVSLLVAAALASGVTSLTPSTPWTAYDQDYRCAAKRTFGEKPGSVMLRLGYAPWSADDTIDLITRVEPRAGARRTVRASAKLSIDFSDGIAPLKMGAGIVSAPAQGVILYRASQIPPEFWGRFAASRTMIVKAGSNVVAQLAYPQADKTFAAFSSCARRLSAAWGWPDPATLSRYPKPASNSWMSDLRYPEAALDRQANGITRVRLNVTAAGLVDECRVVSSSGHADLDAASCLMARNASFSAARNRADERVAAGYIFSALWQPETDGISPDALKLLEEPFSDEDTSYSAPK